MSTSASRRPRMSVVALVALVLVPTLWAPRAAAELGDGHRACDYCRMLVEHDDFGGEVELRSGQVKLYDAIECMAAAVLTDSVAQRDIRAIRVIDHDAPHARLGAGQAVFVHCTAIESPMGQGFLAVRTRARARATCAPPHGTVLDWRGVLARVNRAWFVGKLSVDAHARAGLQPRAVRR
ncbi:MAG: nitrous oxide reductase accessory protein NosL [Candidatus Eisenbacteria bacterium]